MQPQQLIEHFYSSFQRGDWESMQKCYHPNIQFSDPVFTNLNGKSAMAMWHMLLSNAKDLTITFSNVVASTEKGKCHWEATYSFSKTGRKVINKIDAEFTFKDGLIVKHTDHFDLWKWSGMALGLSGKLLGWSQFMKRKIRATANGSLQTFLSKNPAYQ